MRCSIAIALSAVCSGVEGVVSALVVSALVVLGLVIALGVLVLRCFKCSSSLVFYPLPREIKRQWARQATQERREEREGARARATAKSRGPDTELT